ncbi:long-chain fatty acid--CoA ligase [Sphingomicrobium astaxanthinifaciens]|uniref:long-chain fatty acid--CoA ligase n=1 Tax=Sphingomicrobium astaxanthinifaciens TaxID=1227949 RepID=UPI001FCC9763|nr:long-chain fatty acid--CoA ligase [Sphingomicrobium astaxanthinifaciens]MCJ7422370.1 long-chain fatty acid--CoA ligase [Sphingomicrobium astaxanthinifaciens]
MTLRLGTQQDWPLNVMRLVDHAEREHGDREVVSAWADGSTSRTSWGEIARKARQMARALEKLGLGKGDRVATLAMNHERHLISWYGAIGMGGVLHTINPRLFPEQLAYIGNHAEDRVLLYDAMMKPLVDAMKPAWKTIEHYIVYDPPAGWEGDPSFEEWIGAEDDEFRWVEADERDPIGLCYTSGTTGNPKGVIYEHRGMVLHALAEVQPDCFDLGKRDCALPIVPMFHANAWGLPWAAPLVGCKLVLSADYSAKRMVDLFRDEKVTHSAGVPTIWVDMIAHIEKTGDTLDNLKTVTIGGSAAPRAMIKWFRSHGIEVGHAWGMTELSPIGSLAGKPAGWEDMSDEEQIEWTARQGRVPFGIEMRIVDDAGNVLPRDGKASGDLQVRGAWVIERYFKEDAPAIDADGWFSTGDVAALHPDGTMQITDRSKDVIKSGGEWISSIELENAAVGVDGVAEAACIGIFHPKWDERPLLVCVREEGHHVTGEEVLAGIRDQVAKWWLPDAVEFVDELPHTATGKLSKKTLREQFADYRFEGVEAMTGRD